MENGLVSAVGACGNLSVGSSQRTREGGSMHELPKAPAAPTKSTGFPETDWELVRSTGGDREAARQATARLCQLYWYPVYAFVRRFSPAKSADDAMELAQEFLTLRIQKNDITQAAPELGRFRSW